MILAWRTLQTEEGHEEDFFKVTTIKELMANPTLLRIPVENPQFKNIQMEFDTDTNASSLAKFVDLETDCFAFSFWTNINPPSYAERTAQIRLKNLPKPSELNNDEERALVLSTKFRQELAKTILQINEAVGRGDFVLEFDWIRFSLDEGKPIISSFAIKIGETWQKIGWR